MDMSILPLFFIGIIFYIVIKSLSECIQGKEGHGDDFPVTEKRFSLEVFYMLLVTYSIFIVGFGLIYFIMYFVGMMLFEGYRIVVSYVHYCDFCIFKVCTSFKMLEYIILSCIHFILVG